MLDVTHATSCQCAASDNPQSMSECTLGLWTCVKRTIQATIQATGETLPSNKFPGELSHDSCLALSHASHLTPLGSSWLWTVRVTMVQMSFFETLSQSLSISHV